MADRPVPIAIIGMSCKFAGEATDPEKLWKICEERRSAWSRVPSSRFNLDGVYHPNGEKIDSTNVIGGHFLDDDIASFDAAFFGFPTDLAASFDPQFRMQLEGTYEALENAGLSMEDVAGSNTSVFAGAFFKDYHETQFKDNQTLPRNVMLGVGSAMASNRLSHFFDLRGPSLSIDTGCSTTLVAFHQACQSLRCAESDMSIIGGANVILQPDNFVVMSTLKFLSPEGRSFAFDSRASGYGRGEGSGTIIIKRLDDAIRDGDNVRAVVLNSGSNQDGKTETITAPSQDAQEALIRSVYEKAGLDPAETGYFEAHGTGTPTGDPLEVGAISAVFSAAKSPQDPLRIGSVKSNIGHTETASGLASLIKTTLALEKGIVPPSATFETPNPVLRLEERNLVVPPAAEPWPEVNGVRRASVNNFGYGGTNAHVIMEGYESYVRRQANGSAPNSVLNGWHEHVTSRLIVLSAKEEQAALNMARKLKVHLEDLDIANHEKYFDSLVYTLGQKRTRLPWTSAFPVNNVTDLIKILDGPRTKPRRAAAVTPKVGFVFTGQGAQWYAMGRELIEAYPVFKAAVLEAEEALRDVGCDWSLIDELSKDAENTRVNDIAYSTPLSVVVQIALIRLLSSWGVDPAAVTSHSSGEIPAAYAAGAITLRTAMAICFARGQLAGKKIAGVQPGGMIAVGLGPVAAQGYIDQITSGRVVIACYNSPSSITASGDVQGIEELENMLKVEGIFARRLKIDAAYHSHHMEALAEAYHTWLKTLMTEQDTLSSNVIFSSPTTGSRESCGKTISNPLHWVQSLTRPVAFVKAFTSMCLEDDKTKSSSVDIVVEIGPHAALSGPIQEIIGGEDFKGCDVEYFPTLVRKRSAIDTMQELAANLLKAGYKLDMEAINFPFGRKNAQLLQNLPRYPWNHSIRHWAEPRVSKAVRSRALPSHDLVGSLIPGTNSITPTWRHIIRLADIPWLRDHVVQSDILFPGAGFLCMAIEASAQLAVSEGKKPVGYRLRDVQIDRGLLIPDTLDASKSVELQLTLERTDDKTIATPGWRAFRICSVTVDNEWTEHCSGLIDVESETASPKIMTWQDPLSDVRLARHGQDAEYWKVMDPQDLYAAIRATGIDHGPIFQNIQTVHQRRNQSLASVKVADTAATMPCGHEAAHVIHPTTIDTIFQASYSAYLATPESGSKLSTPLVPRTIKSIELRADKLPKAGSMLKIYCDVTSASKNGFTSDMAIYENADNNKDEQPLLQINGFTVTAIGPAIEPRQSDIFDLEKLATVEWKKDITFLSKEQLRQELSSPSDAEEAAIMTDLSRVTFHYIRQALEQLNEKTMAQLEWYHEKYVTWMKLQVILAQQNELSPDSSTWFDDPPELVAKLTAKVKATTVNGEMVCCLGPQIPAILRHEVTPLEAMMEDKLLHRYYEDAIKWERTTCKLGQIVQHMTHKNPRMKILEIGAGTGGATKRILSAVGHQAASYEFTDISSGFFEEAQAVLSEYSDIMRYKRLDVEQDPAGQGFEEGSYDVIVACQVLHATKNMEHTMSNVRRLLKPGGRLCLMETTKDALDLLFAFGLLPGWWLSEEKERQWSPSLSVNMWDSVLQKTGFGGIEIEVHDCEDEDFYSFSVISATVPKDVEAEPANLDTLIVTGTENAPSSEWLGELQTLLADATGNRPNIVSLDCASTSCSGKICVFVGGDNVLLDPTSEEFDAIKAATIQSKGLLWITSGASIDSENPVAAMSVGFLRTIRSEYSGKRLVHLDLEPSNPWSADSLFNIAQVLSSVFDPSEEASDFEYAVRDGEVLIPRYIKDEARISRLFHQPSQTAAPVTTIEPFAQQGRPLRLDVGVPGLLDTIHFVDNPNAAKPLPEDYVEISPKAFGINFRDVMTAMGQLESDITGLECSGVVKRVGPLAAARSNLRPGDRVAALLRGHFADTVSTNWTSVVPIPANMSFETAASIPLAFATSYISLVDMAHIQAGESVLIHSAAGGVGQAAVTIAQHIGAEVFVTVGSQGKREFMTEKYGIADNHIFSSRDHSFAAGIMRMTNGRGVDVVLNSLAGSLLQKSLNCVARFGRFVEIGKRDLEGNSKLEMEVFKRQVAFSSVDLLQMEEFRGEWVQRALKSLMHLLRNGNIVPNEPIVSYPLAEVEKPFRLMQAGKHMGKFVLTVRPDEMVPVGQRKLKASLRPDASYLIVGGLGGIGRSICHWMADKGAKNIIVMSRSAGSSNKSNEVTEEMRKLGVKLLPVSCDVSDPLALSRAVEESGRIMPPVRGVVQAAMVLSDSILEKMTLDAWVTATRPKVHGSLNLHKQFSSPEVDFFIMLSSLSGVTGFVSQSNYAAGNTFQDALARHRVCSGLHGASIDIGIVNSVGYLIEHKEQMERLRKQQYHVLSETDVLSVIEEAIVSKPDRQMLLGLNGANLDNPTEARFWSLPWRAKTSDAANNGAGAGKASSNSAGDLAGVLSCAETFADAVDAVRKSIVTKLMDIFMIDEADIDPKRSVSDLGVDSLVAVELRNLLALRAGAKVSIFDIMSSTSLNAFAENITMKSSFVDAGIITSKAN